MFRWTASSCRAIACTFALIGFAIPALADDPTPASAPQLPATSLGKPGTPPKASATPPGPALPAPSSTPPAPPQPDPLPPASGQPAPAQSVPSVPALPGLGNLMTPNGVALPGGIGFIRPGADTVGIQINTPDGPFEITVPRRRRNGRVQQGPPTPEATTDAPAFGQAGQPAPTPGPQAGIPAPSLEGERPLSGDLNPRDAGRGNRGSREFAHASRLFHARNYPAVLRRLNRAMVRESGDRDLLQLRSLTQLALGDFHAAYTDAATVLAQDDVWDWSTLRSLYHSADEYTSVYRGIEDRVVADPNAIELRVLLAYHNLMLGHRDAARRHFERVLALDPSNDVARRIVTAELPPQPRPEPTRAETATGSSSRPALTPIPSRRRPGSANPGSTGGVSIDLGQPAPVAPQKAPQSKSAG
jgi:hypothetical protein